MVKCPLSVTIRPSICYEQIAFTRGPNGQVGEIHTVKQKVAIQVIGLFRTDLQLGFFTLPFSSRFTVAYPLKPTTKWVSKYECLDSNQVKAANLAERVYKTPLTTKSHSLLRL